MMIHRISILLAVFILAYGCGSKNNGQDEKKPGASLPFLPQADIQTLYNGVEKVDILFYKLPISVSQDDPQSAKNTVGYITPAQPTHTGTCPATGRIAWIADGKIMREADFHFDSLCHYFRFVENNVFVYENQIGTEGIQFFTMIMKQTDPTQKPQQ